MNKTNESDISNLILGNSYDIKIKIDKDISIMLNEKTPKTPKEAKAKRVTKPKKVKENKKAKGYNISSTTIIVISLLFFDFRMALAAIWVMPIAFAIVLGVVVGE